MQTEVTVGSNFILSYLYNKLPRRRVNMFGEELEKYLKIKYQDHWFPDNPYRESGYRCIKISADNVDLTLIKAANDSGMVLQEILKTLPSNMSLWMDPGEVSYRLNEQGIVKIIYEDDFRSKLRYKKYDSLQKNLNCRLHHHHHHHHRQNHHQSMSNIDLFDDDDINDLNMDNNSECTCYCEFEMVTATNFHEQIPNDDLGSYDGNLNQLSGNMNNLETSFGNLVNINKPQQLMNSQSNTSLANSKIYRTNMFSSTHNINLSQQQQQRQSQQNHQTAHFMPMNNQLQGPIAQLNRTNNMQRLLTTSIDSLNKPFSLLSFNNNNTSNDLHNNDNSETTNMNGNTMSLWSLSSMHGTSTNHLLSGSSVEIGPSGALSQSNINKIAQTPSTPLSSSPPPPLTTLKTPLTPTASANTNQLFTTASFSQTKFGSTKTKMTNKKQQKMSPSEFSTYIKQKAQMQQINKTLTGSVGSNALISVVTMRNAQDSSKHTSSPPIRPLSVAITNDFYNFDYATQPNTFNNNSNVNYLSTSSDSHSFLSDSPPSPAPSSAVVLKSAKQQPAVTTTSQLLKHMQSLSREDHNQQNIVNDNSLVSGFANIANNNNPYQVLQANKQDFNLFCSNSSSNEHLPFGYITTSNSHRPNTLPLAQQQSNAPNSPTSSYFKDFNNNNCGLNELTNEDLSLYQPTPALFLSGTDTTQQSLNKIANNEIQVSSQTSTVSSTNIQSTSASQSTTTTTNSASQAKHLENGSSFKNQLLMAN
jgi:hypothetical protein